jgi:DNA-binding transcriptional ArsR family regulator
VVGSTVGRKTQFRGAHHLRLIRTPSLKPKNLEILSALATRPMSTRQLAKLLNALEANVSSRLQELVKLGFVKDEGWSRLEGRNLKLYSLNVNAFSLEFLPQGYRLRFKRVQATQLESSHFFTGDFEPPDINFEFIGRKIELQRLSKGHSVLLWRIAGSGKTTLVSRFVQTLELPVFWHRIKETDSFFFVANKFALFCLSSAVAYHSNL